MISSPASAARHSQVREVRHYSPLSSKTKKVKGEGRLKHLLAIGLCRSARVTVRPCLQQEACMLTKEQVELSETNRSLLAKVTSTWHLGWEWPALKVWELTISSLQALLSCFAAFLPLPLSSFQLTCLKFFHPNSTSLPFQDTKFYSPMTCSLKSQIGPTRKWYKKCLSRKILTQRCTRIKKWGFQIL